MHYNPIPEFVPEQLVLDQIGIVGRELATMFAKHRQAAPVLEYLKNMTGLALIEVELGDLEGDAAPAAEAIPAMQGAYKHLSVAKDDESVAAFGGNPEHNLATRDDACKLLGYASLIGVFNMQTQLRQAPHLYPSLLWGLRGTVQMGGLAMQRVLAAETPDPEQFMQRQRQLVLGSNLALTYLSQFQGLREAFKPVRGGHRHRPPRSTE